MPQKNTYQKILFAFLATASLVSLQGCGSQATQTNDTTNTSTTPVKTETDAAMTGEVVPTNTGTKTSATTQPTQPTTKSTTETAVGLNGTFHLTSTYGSPGGPEPLDATVTLKNDVITAVSANNVAVHPVSKKFQDMFIAGVAGQVVGKNIKDVKITYVNGSSLTAVAFNKALHDLEK